jgi:hypothetical protein
MSEAVDERLSQIIWLETEPVHVWITNKHSIGIWIRDSWDLEEHIYPLSVTRGPGEMAEFHRLHANDLAILEKFYTEIEVGWGLLTWVS